MKILRKANVGSNFTDSYKEECILCMKRKSLQILKQSFRRISLVFSKSWLIAFSKNYQKPNVLCKNYIVSDVKIFTQTWKYP